MPLSRRARVFAWAAICLLMSALAACRAVPPLLAGAAGGASASSPPAARSGRPTHLWIPTIGLDWPVVPVGLDANGAMDTPQGPESAPSWHEGFWWEYGYRVGETGNAVIAGHVDDVAGDLTAFARIATLQPGDTLEVKTDQGSTLRFVVTRVSHVANPIGGPNDPTIRDIFGPAQTANLNLITCTGTWVGNEFDQRLVVYTTLA